MGKESFIFYRDWKDAIQDLPDNVRLEIYETVIEYAITGTVRELEPVSNIAFSFIKQTIDMDVIKYNAVIERNRANGLKGGAPKGNNNASKKQPKQPKRPKQADNDNDNDNDNDLNKENINKKEKIQFAEFVSMTNDEYKSLVAKLGSEENVTLCIKILDNYKGSKGAKYKSDYRAILSWVIDKFNEKNNNAKTEQSKNNTVTL